MKSWQQWWQSRHLDRAEALNPNRSLWLVWSLRTQYQPFFQVGTRLCHSLSGVLTNYDLKIFKLLHIFVINRHFISITLHRSFFRCPWSSEAIRHTCFWKIGTLCSIRGQWGFCHPSLCLNKLAWGCTERIYGSKPNHSSTSLSKLCLARKQVKLAKNGYAVLDSLENQLITMYLMQKAAWKPKEFLTWNRMSSSCSFSPHSWKRELEEKRMGSINSDL